jgi:1-deoxy-D-xylulose-5-phosphate reductoisomerase
MAGIRNIAILGSTGSIGRSTLEVVAHFPDRFRVKYLTAHRNVDLLREQVERFRPRAVVVHEASDASVLRTMTDGLTDVLFGADGLHEVVTRSDVDLVVSAMVGFAGLVPTLAAIGAGKDVALANKETLVVGGALVMQALQTHGVRLLPVDSEHSAILQCLQGEDAGSAERLILTASGGPFRLWDGPRLASVTPAEALVHPTWRMGKKITVDSSTLMNKGLEVIEAHWLFGLPPAAIQVVIHPQSIVHSLVQFADGSIKAQLGVPDMKLPIQYALTYPERPRAPYPRLDLAALGQMTFEEPDLKRFPCLALAYRALEMGGTAPAVLNAANEVAVELFLNGQISFPMIPALIEEALDHHAVLQNPSLEDLLRIDAQTRTALTPTVPLHE